MLNDEEWGEKLEVQKVPIKRGRTVLYLHKSSDMLSTGYHILVCCYRMGKWLIECRNENLNKVMNGRFRTTWMSMEKFSGREVENICKINREY